MYEEIRYIPYLKEGVTCILVYKTWLLESEFLRKKLDCYSVREQQEQVLDEGRRGRSCGWWRGTGQCPPDMAPSHSTQPEEQSRACKSAKRVSRLGSAKTNCKGLSPSRGAEIPIRPRQSWPWAQAARLQQGPWCIGSGFGVLICTFFTEEYIC